MGDRNIQRRKKKNQGDMGQMVQSIIECQNRDYEMFMDYQEKKIRELQSVKDKQKRGEQVDLSGVLSSLRKSGILDSENKIAQPYAMALNNGRR